MYLSKLREIKGIKRIKIGRSHSLLNGKLWIMQLGMQQSKYNNIGCKTANKNKIITIRWCTIKEF